MSSRCRLATISSAARHHLIHRPRRPRRAQLHLPPVPLPLYRSSSRSELSLW